MSGRIGADRGPGWLMTFAHLRAVLVAAVGVLAALVMQRPDLLILVTPMGVIASWSVLTRPNAVPERRLLARSHGLREGQWVNVSVQATHVPGSELLCSSIAGAPYIEHDPPHGAQVHVVDEADAARGLTTVATRVRLLRWGRRTIGPVRVGSTSAWGAFRWGPVSIEEQGVTALPDPAVFDMSAPAPHPRGLVGRHRSPRPGEGSEFASVRRFHWGDRLKRIHWSRSLRTGELHVTSSYADQDTHVAIVVDAHYDLGHSGGVTGGPSTLDHSVRAAAAIAEHFLQQGDRVSLQVLSSRTPFRVRVGSGRRHQRRVLETLALVLPGLEEESADPRRLRLGLGAGALVVMISSLVSPGPLTQAAALARSGLSVVVIDALIDDVEPPGERDDIAEFGWRIRMVERDREVRRIRQAGLPVVPWAGPGSLDAVLRSLARRGHRGAAG